MNRTKKLTQLMIVLGGLWMSTNVYATEGVLPIGSNKTGQTVVKETPLTKVKPQTTTESTITFDEGEYVRITQPLTKDVIETFDSEINVMGEARMDTELNIVTYTTNSEKKVDKPSVDTANYTEYKLKKVGATQTFSQLIKLHEGFNHIIIYYTYQADNKESLIEIVIERKSEEVKEQIKNYIVTDPKVILDQIPK